MLGVPVNVRPERWVMARHAVAGRFVNCYSRRDWMLGLVYRGSAGFVKAAGGLCPVKLAGVENVNLTGLVAGHFDYMTKLQEILDLIHIRD